MKTVKEAAVEIKRLDNQITNLEKADAVHESELSEIKEKQKKLEEKMAEIDRKIETANQNIVQAIDKHAVVVKEATENSEQAAKIEFALEAIEKSTGQRFDR